MPNLTGRHILLLEDEYFLAVEIEDAIVGAGGKVVGPFSKMSDAAGALSSHIDAAVLNVRVRDGLSYPFASLLCERDIPFLFATAQQSSTEPEQWRSYQWLSKPYDIPAMLIALESLINRSSQVELKS